MIVGFNIVLLFTILILYYIYIITKIQLYFKKKVLKREQNATKMGTTQYKKKTMMIRKF